MQRRRLSNSPILLAVWARRLAIFSCRWSCSRSSWRGPAVQSGADPGDVRRVLVLAVLAILLAVAALVGIWFDGRAGAGYAFRRLRSASPARLSGLFRDQGIPTVGDQRRHHRPLSIHPGSRRPSALRSRSANSDGLRRPAVYQRQQ